MFLVYRLKFCITIIYDFSWDDCITQEKLETMVLGFGGALWSMWKWWLGHHAFLYISLSPLHDYGLKMPNFKFCGEREHKKTTFVFFPWTSIQSFRIQLQKKLPIFDGIERDGISPIKSEAARIHFLSDVFVAVAVFVG